MARRTAVGDVVILPISMRPIVLIRAFEKDSRVENLLAKRMSAGSGCNDHRKAGSQA